ncbi:MAG: DNA recombination protein RmuC [Shewanella sp.]|nr:DNA recombination protein RmuC [Shewanella sp.]MCF1429668.1 DNA recombination protein RmuC [Shewanella sp.]MCF1437422.1 DNA recombination protein RmuC [Shewanella sp.]MCF1456302.1 DNA recombination protein RmuC [Shewanella sp.]
MDFTQFSITNLLIFSAVALMFLMLGALLNQKLTRARWQAARDQLNQQHTTEQLSLQQELEHTQQQQDQLTDELHFCRQRLEKQSVELGKLAGRSERLEQLENQLDEAGRNVSQLQLALSQEQARGEQLAVRFQAEEKALQDKIELLESAESRLKTQFEHLAQKIFEERSESFRAQNMHQLDGVLGPLKQQLDGFRQQISESNQQAQTERHSLKFQLEQLQAMNLRMSQDAINLTQALKGDNKQLGNWGEVILERVLQESGLREGHEYHTQTDLKNDQGKRFKPDVIVHLPQDKHVVIDAKMSLVAYERYFNSQDDQEKAQALREHVISVRSHIRGLGHKDYQHLHGLKSLDYVLMFIPIEPAFLLAIEEDPQLVNLALEQNIMLVSPTNLLVALRTINNIWRYEHQNQNAQIIARQAGRIYDKLCGYVEEMDKLGRSLDTAQRSYQNAMGRLSTGKGNLIRQAHQMKQLGATASKQFDTNLLEGAIREDNEEHTGS